jgi:predicted nucleic acid-binding protein
VTGLTLDAGALIALERRDERLRRLLGSAWPGGVALPAAALAQVWRASARQHGLGLLLLDPALEVVPLDSDEALMIGAVCARSGATDVVDVSVAVCARRRGHAVVTSDPDDLLRIDPDLDLIVI